MYLFILPGFVYFIVFRYLPLLGNIIAFQDYSPFLGFHSPWVGLANFHRLFTNLEGVGGGEAGNIHELRYVNISMFTWTSGEDTIAT